MPTDLQAKYDDLHRANGRRGHIEGGTAHGPIFVKTTNHVYVDGRKVQTTISSQTVQSGTTAHDGRMSAYPAGTPAGAGN